jgi:hypothetical protein
MQYFSCILLLINGDLHIQLHTEIGNKYVVYMTKTIFCSAKQAALNFNLTDTIIAKDI